jgi:8-oxo-dGTP pyrophosphatase MutT (NUDIX family)
MTDQKLEHREYEISLDRLDAYVKAEKPHGEREGAKEALAALLFATTGSKRNRYNRELRAAKQGATLALSSSLAAQVLALVAPQHAEPEKLLGQWSAHQDRFTFRQLPGRSAEDGEIELRTLHRGNLIDRQTYPTAATFAAVHVDRVRFYQEVKGGAPVISDGEYLRIEPPSGQHGASVLPVDEASGDVLLVTQWRHAPQRFMTEIPRGFALVGADRNELDSARRELHEEAGYLPKRRADGVEALYHLKSTQTDSGKLWECPGHFLAYVDRDRYVPALNEINPAMEDPVWIRLPAFLRALYAREPVQLAPDEYRFALPPRHLARMRAKTDISAGRLALDDAFTVQCGLLALPHLIRKYGPGILPA